MRRRRLLYRSWHRGTKEMDLIMGRFADAVIDSLSDAELDDYEALLQAPDPDLYRWIAGKDGPAPDYDGAMFRRLYAFHNPTGSGAAG